MVSVDRIQLVETEIEVFQRTKNADCIHANESEVVIS